MSHNNDTSKESGDDTQYYHQFDCYSKAKLGNELTMAALQVIRMHTFISTI